MGSHERMLTRARSEDPLRRILYHQMTPEQQERYRSLIDARGALGGLSAKPFLIGDML